MNIGDRILVRDVINAEENAEQATAKRRAAEVEVNTATEIERRQHARLATLREKLEERGIEL